MKAMISKQVASRLWNWKFAQAHQLAASELVSCTASDAPSEDEFDTITQLMIMFGDAGYFSGAMPDIIRAAVAWLLQQPLDAPDSWLPKQLRSEGNE
jgi:hypothetical protein